jgi:DNA-binding PadR family transcriptional regulator
MSVPYTILGVLMNEPAHGYSIRKHLEEEFSKSLPLNDGQLYPALAKLEGLGWIEKEVVEQRRSPTKHLYRVTEAGRDAFLRWLAGEGAEEPPDRLAFFWRDGFLQRCSFFGQLDAGEAAELIRVRLGEAAHCAERLEEVSADLARRDAEPYRRMIVEYGVRLQRMREQWLQELLAMATEPVRDTRRAHVR